MNTSLPASPATETSTPPAPAALPADPLALRAVRVLALLGLSGIFSLILGLALFSSIPLFQESFHALITWTGGQANLHRAGLFSLGLVLAVTTAVLFAAWRLKLRSWWWIAGGYLAAAPILAYLATDEPTYRFPVTIEELAPAFPGAEKSFDVLMRYGKQHPLGKSFSDPRGQDIGTVFAGKAPKDGLAWRDHVVKNRATIEKRWDELAPVWAWWNEVNAFDRIGDLTKADLGAELLAFAPCRTVSQFGWGHAMLLAVDGRGDEAIDVLLPLLQVSRKLQPPGRTLVRIMIGVVIEKGTLQVINLVLDQASVSAAARARLAAALQPGNVEAAARRLILVDYVMTLATFIETNYKIGDILVLGGNNENSWIGRPLNLLSPFVYNRRASFNLYGEYMRDLAELVARREMAKLPERERQFFDVECAPRFKNFMGLLTVNQLIPAYTKVTTAFWEAHDLRAGLLARITAK